MVQGTLCQRVYGTVRLIKKILKLGLSYYAGYIGGWVLVFSILAVIGAIVCITC